MIGDCMMVVGFLKILVIPRDDIAVGWNNMSV